MQLNEARFMYTAPIYYLIMCIDGNAESHQLILNYLLRKVKYLAVYIEVQASCTATSVSMNCAAKFAKKYHLKL